MNSAELARRQFREIARVAGLVFQGYPGSGKSTRQLQSSSGLFFDVFTQYDPHNLLLEQARYNSRVAAIGVPGLQALDLISSLQNFQPSAQTENVVSEVTGCPVVDNLEVVLRGE